LRLSTLDTRYSLPTDYERREIAERYPTGNNTLVTSARVVFERKLDTGNVNIESRALLKS